ncbi:DUF4390 domain-containing protein [Pseudogulbenkiania sp. NH8B]|jgi:hypothetical protein|uniref:Proline rich signal peptide protein n=1 Tax=Pseudogulbenkiania ferrooxidans 2002 TaxID=279714 RepID=B9Z618_9NEIS|nr:DUF4390 domain-containing protein [Pseudogulbenkiania sp. NH8B]EEG08015.1 conserved hypothetical protein [Pseudogulbenkiania ferrooxidans 2002]
MTASITRCLRSASLLIWLIACAVLPAWADSISATRSEAELLDGQLAVSTRFDIKLTPGLSDALTQGVALPFRLEFELTRPRSTAYLLNVREWFEPHAELHFKIAYQSLTSRYRVSIGSLSRYYATQAEALSALGAIHGWRVLEAGTLSGVPADKVKGRVRLMLDIGQLPKPFQLNALGSADWSLGSGWIDLNVKEGG